MSTLKTETVEERSVANLVTVRLIRQTDHSRTPSRQTYGVDVLVNGYHVRVASGFKTMDDAGSVAASQMRIAEQTVEGLRRRIADKVTRQLAEA